MAKFGVYRIRNIKTGKFYIGSAGGYKGVVGRLSTHRSKLRSQTHNNPKLQAAWNKYGEGVFVFETVEICPAEKCLEREQWYLDNWLFASSNDDRFHRLGYNINRKATSRKGAILSSQTKRKIAQSLKGHKQSEKTKQRRRAAQSGEKGNNAKFTQQQVEEVKLLYRQGLSKAELARRFGVAHSTVSRMIEGKTWKM